MSVQMYAFKIYSDRSQTNSLKKKKPCLTTNNWPREIFTKVIFIITTDGFYRVLQFTEVPFSPPFAFPVIVLRHPWDNFAFFPFDIVIWEAGLLCMPEINLLSSVSSHVGSLEEVFSTIPRELKIIIMSVIWITFHCEGDRVWTAT